jgi:hypothetical protein
MTEALFNGLLKRNGRDEPGHDDGSVEEAAAIIATAGPP